MDAAPDKAAPVGGGARDVDANAVLELGPSGLATWDYDLTTGRVSLSDIWSVLLGGDRRPTVTTIRELTKLVPEEDRPMVRDAIIKAVKGSGISTYQVTHRVTKSNGAIAWILSEGKVIERDKNGRALRMVGTNRDITESVITQYALHESREWFQVLIESAPAALALLDQNMRYLATSRRWMTDFHLGHRGIIGKSHYDIFPEISDRVKEVHRRCLAGETVRTDESPFERSDGSVQWLKWECRPWHTASGQVGGIVIFCEDITDRKLSDLAVKADMDAMAQIKGLSELFLIDDTLDNWLLKIIDTAIAITGADFGTVQLLDSDTGELRLVAHHGLPSWWLDFWNTVGRGEGACGSAIAQGSRVIVEDIENSPLFMGTPALEIQRRAGIRAVQSTPLLNRAGKVLGAFSTHYKTPKRPDERTLTLLDLLARQAADIIDRVQLVGSIRQSNREIAVLQQNQVALQTASAFAHELNQPLLAIASYCATVETLLLSHPPDLKRIGEAAMKSEKQALRAGGAIREWLRLLEVRHARSEALDINDEIKSALVIAKSEHGVACRVKLFLAKNIPPVLANRLHIRKVLLNLLNNGVEAMQEAGVQLPEIVVRVRTKRDHNVALVTIRDKGPGFPREHLDQLFEPFFTTKRGGIGMGLSISRSLIEANGGQLWADPDGGPGAAVHFTLPFAA